MESVLGRYRNLTILVGVLFLQVLGLAVQVKRSADAEHTRLIRIWAVDAITPFERVLVWAQNRSGNVWHNYFFLRGVRAENRQLKEQIEQMRLEQVRLSEDAAQARRLQSLLAFKEQTIAKTVPAQVIGSSGSDLSQSIYIDKGSNDGIAQDMAVITVGGIVGKVLRVYPTTSLVLMINDQSSGVGALLEKSRLQGVLRGSPNGELVLDRVMSDEQVSPGDILLSSGGDQIFPKGLPVGTVTKVNPGKELFLSIKVKPAADLSRLEEVLVVTEKREQEPVAESSGVRVRAADILAQRLPSVPAKPAMVVGAPPTADENTAAGQTSSAVAKPPANGAARPITGNAIKPEGSASAGPAGNAANQSLAHDVPISGQPVTTQILKKAVQKPASRDSDTDVAAGSTAASNPDDSSVKPAKAPSKPSSAQSLPQPPASDDNPH
ncbi:MAG TPA: rod shape-determining protein MreC [Candidatus Eremiobacteraceae bacterium]|nr:rod shape-determining protein MreC [Candidatus Eremiobacteraceae bacterium]